jgi:predicted secreted protein
MQEPECVYQMGLRIGVSYDATCRALHLHKLIPTGIMQSLLAIKPKEIKRSILPAGHEPDNFHCDVWLLTESDHGIYLEGHPDDLFVMRLREKSGSGYLWDPDMLRAEGFNILHESHDPIPGNEQVGDDSIYELMIAPAPRSTGQIDLAETRPWQRTSTRNTLTVNYDVRGKELGMSRAERHQHLAA